MRVTFVVVVLALAAAGCEKAPPAAENGKQLAPAGEAAATPGSRVPSSAREDQAGEPMDDVEEAESPSDKSGAGDPSEGEGDTPEGEKIDVEE